jgi:methionyl-tRNA formyltransferase
MRWAMQMGHQLALVVTSPGPKSRRSSGFKEIAALAGENNFEVLISTRMKTGVTPILQQIKPDLILSFTFPWLLPPELLATARIGAVNLHPTVLPAYRGPNVMRQVYDGASHIGATLHWTEAEFDTGNIIAQHTAPLPEYPTRESVFELWPRLMMGALAEGVARAVAGDKGRPQSSEGASYAAPFTDEEHWLNWGESARSLQCKVTGLNLIGIPSAKAKINGENWLIERLDFDMVSVGAANEAPGTVISQSADGSEMHIAVADGVVKIKAGKL